MNNIYHQEAVKKAVQPRFHGHSRLNSKTTPIYPDSAEREYKRIANAYMRLLNETLKEELPGIMSAYQLYQHGDSRFDDLQDLEGRVRIGFRAVAQKLEQKLSKFGLDHMIRKVSRITRNTTLNSWKKSVKQTLGVDLMKDYYRRVRCDGRKAARYLLCG